MKTVWIPKLAGHDFRCAEKFGEHVVVFQESLSPFAIESARKALRNRLREHPPQSGDYLLFSGAAIFSALMLHELLVRVGMVTLLIFHAREKIYVERRVFSDATAEAREAAHESRGVGTNS